MKMWQDQEAAIRILIVDDNLDVLDSLNTLFKLSGFSVRATNSGRAALASYLADPVDVVLADLGMPKMTGFELVEGLRRAPETPLMIAMTGWTRPGDESATSAAGFDHYVTKPVDTDALEAFIRRRVTRFRELSPPRMRDSDETTRASGRG